MMFPKEGKKLKKKPKHIKSFSNKRQSTETKYRKVQSEYDYTSEIKRDGQSHESDDQHLRQ